MSTRVELRQRGRKALDRRLAAWRQLPSGGARPHGGWIRAIREALGMTAAELGGRMGIGQSVVTRLEQSERSGRVQLDTLRRAADALECEVVYALVPRRSLDEMVTERAAALARRRLARVGHTMALEDQLVDNATMRAKLDLLTEQYRSASGLWRIEEPMPQTQDSGEAEQAAPAHGLG